MNDKCFKILNDRLITGLTALLIFTIILGAWNINLTLKFNAQQENIESLTNYVTNQQKELTELTRDVNRNTETIDFTSVEIWELRTQHLEPLLDMVKNTNEKLVEILERYGEQMNNRWLKETIVIVLIGACISLITGWNYFHYYIGVFVGLGSVFYSEMEDKSDD